MTRSFQEREPERPSRRSMLLVYACCIVIPFAVASMAYALRAFMSSPPTHTLAAKPSALQGLSASTSLVPSATAAEVQNPISPSANLPSK